MRLALATALALIAAAPASAAETVGRSAVTAGPVLAGGSVLWADAPSGRPRVLANGAVLASWPAAHAKDTGRAVAALAGSGSRVAAVVETCTTTADGDAVFLGCADRAFGGAGFAPLGRPLPSRGPSRCTGARAPVSVAAGAGVIAVAETRACQGIAQYARSARSRIVIRRGASTQVLAARSAAQLRIAGRFLAYLDGDRVVLYDLARRTRVRSTRLPGVLGLDVQADGALAVVRTEGRRTCVSVVRRREHLRACGVSSGRVGIAGGRVMFERGRRLMLGRRVLARGRFAGFDLAADRAVWAVGPPVGRQRIVLERL